MAESAYRHTDVKAYATIGGVKTEIVSVSVRYAINAIPTASVILAVGRNAEGDATSTAVRAYTQQMYRLPITIHANYGNTGYFLLFRGYVSGVSIKKSSNMYGVAVGAVSWFNDLNAGTPFSSGLTAAATLYDLSVPIAVRVGTEGGGEPKYSLTSLQRTIENTIAGGESIGGAIMKTALELTGSGDVGGNTALNQAISNQACADALNATTIKLTSALGDSQDLATGFGNAIGAGFWTTFAGSTLWHALLSMTVSMGYVIIPLINRMYIVPWTPILAKPATTFSATTIAATNNNFNVAPNIKTLLIYNTDSMVTYSLLSGQTKSPGFFVNESMESGMTDMASAPRWLKDTFSASSSEETMTVDAGIRSRSDQSGQDVEFSVDAQKLEAMHGLTSAAAKYAKFMYALRALGGTSTIMGPPKNGVIPGINIRFSLGDDVGEMDGFVNAVVYNIDSENHATDMSIELTQVRSPSDSASLGMDSGVMWTDVVGGGDLISDLVSAEASKEEDI